MKYAITGATGKFAHAAITELLTTVPAKDLVLIARNTEKAKELYPDLEVRFGDYDDEASLVQALTGVDKLLFISSLPGGALPRIKQHENVIVAAKKAGVPYIAYTSFAHADQATSALADDHKATEKMLIDSGLDYSFLRNNWYLENEASNFTGNDFLEASNGHAVGWALEAEYAQGAAKVLQLETPKKIYEFSGPAHTYADMAQVLTKIFEKEIKPVPVSVSAYKKALTDAGLPEATIMIATLSQEVIAAGDLEHTTRDLPDVLGHELTPFAEAIKQLSAH